MIEGQQGVGSDFDFDGDMEEVHPADGNRASVFGTEFARSANGVAPVELGVRPVAESDFLFEEADLIARLTAVHGTDSLQLPKGIEDLDAMPGRPDDTRQWMRSNGVIAIPWFASLRELKVSQHEVSA